VGPLKHREARSNLPPSYLPPLDESAVSYKRSQYCSLTNYFRVSFTEGVERSTDPPKIYDFNFFLIKCTFEIVLLLQKQYVT